MLASLLIGKGWTLFLSSIRSDGDTLPGRVAAGTLAGVHSNL